MTMHPSHPTDLAFVDVKFVPVARSNELLAAHTELMPAHWLGFVSYGAAENDFGNSYRLADEGIDPLEIRATSRAVALAAVIGACELRGWRWFNVADVKEPPMSDDESEAIGL